jgi:hypothetical protein
MTENDCPARAKASVTWLEACRKVLSSVCRTITSGRAETCLCPRLVGKYRVDIPAHSPIWRSGGASSLKRSRSSNSSRRCRTVFWLSPGTLSIDARPKGDSKRIRQATRCRHPMRLGNNLPSANCVVYLPCPQRLYHNLPHFASCKCQPREQPLCAVPNASVHGCCSCLLLRAGGPRLDWLHSISATMRQKWRESAGSRAQFARRHIAAS